MVTIEKGLHMPKTNGFSKKRRKNTPKNRGQGIVISTSLCSLTEGIQVNTNCFIIE